MTPFKKYKLGELGEVITGKTPASRFPQHFGNYIPFITPSDFGGYIKSAESAERYISKEGVEAHKNKILPENSVLVTCIGSDMGKVVVNKKPCLTNQQINSIIPNKEVVDYNFLYYSIINQYDLLRSIASDGTTMPIINKTDFEEIEIEAPEDLPTQTLIASLLSSLDDKIELNRRTNHTLEQIAQTLFKKYFIDDIDPENLPEGWRWGVLSDIVEFSNGNAFSSKDLLDENNGNCYHVFKMGHIKRGGGLNSEGTKSYFSKTKASGLEKYILKKGDLLMCMTDMKDSMALLGHTALMNESDKYIANQRVGLLRVNNELNINYPFLYLLTNSSDFIEDLRSRANSGVQVNLSTGEIKNSRIIIPEKSINKKFNAAVEPMYEKIFSKIKENEKLISIRDSLLPKLMSGEIEVNATEKELVN